MAQHGFMPDLVAEGKRTGEHKQSSRLVSTNDGSGNGMRRAARSSLHSNAQSTNNGSNGNGNGMMTSAIPTSPFPARARSPTRAAARASRGVQSHPYQYGSAAGPPMIPTAGNGGTRASANTIGYWPSATSSSPSAYGAPHHAISPYAMSVGGGRAGIGRNMGMEHLINVGSYHYQSQATAPSLALGGAGTSMYGHGSGIVGTAIGPSNAITAGNAANIQSPLITPYGHAVNNGGNGSSNPAPLTSWQSRMFGGVNATTNPLLSSSTISSSSSSSTATNSTSNATTFPQLGRSFVPTPQPILPATQPIPPPTASATAPSAYASTIYKPVLRGHRNHPSLMDDDATIAAKHSGKRRCVTVDLSECHTEAADLVRTIIAKYDILQEDTRSVNHMVHNEHYLSSLPNILWTGRRGGRIASNYLRLNHTGGKSRTNHFPGIDDFCTKSYLGRKLALFKSLFPSEYKFHPDTWIIPAELVEFEKAFDASNTYILKPSNGTQGKGIELAQSWADVQRITNGTLTRLHKRLKKDQSVRNDTIIAQHYIANPLLLGGLKFDFRVYVMLESLDPLVMHLYKDGMVRFCTQPYTPPTAENLRQSYMHLTNYHLNKNNTEGFKLSGVVNVPAHQPGISSPRGGGGKTDQEEKTNDGNGMTTGDDDEADVEGGEGDERMDADDEEPRSTETKQVYREVAEEESSKRSIRLVLAQLRAAGIQLTDDAFWAQVGSIVQKTLIAIWAPLWASYQMMFKQAPTSPCFHILGFDFMLDSNLNMWLLEINTQPSFNADSPLDVFLKQGVIEKTFGLLGYLSADDFAHPNNVAHSFPFPTYVQPTLPTPAVLPAATPAAASTTTTNVTSVTGGIPPIIIPTSATDDTPSSNTPSSSQSSSIAATSVGEPVPPAQPQQMETVRRPIPYQGHKWGGIAAPSSTLVTAPLGWSQPLPAGTTTPATVPATSSASATTSTSSTVPSSTVSTSVARRASATAKLSNNNNTNVSSSSFPSAATTRTNAVAAAAAAANVLSGSAANVRPATPLGGSTTPTAAATAAAAAAAGGNSIWGVHPMNLFPNRPALLRTFTSAPVATTTVSVAEATAIMTSNAVPSTSSSSSSSSSTMPPLTSQPSLSSTASTSSMFPSLRPTTPPLTRPMTPSVGASTSSSSSANANVTSSPARPQTSRPTTMVTANSTNQTATTTATVSSSTDPSSKSNAPSPLETVLLSPGNDALLRTMLMFKSPLIQAIFDRFTPTVRTKALSSSKFVQMCNCCGILSKSFTRAMAEHMFINATRHSSPERSMDFACFTECLLAIARQSFTKETATRAMELLLQRNSLTHDGHLILASSPVERTSTSHGSPERDTRIAASRRNQ